MKLVAAILLFAILVPATSFAQSPPTKFYKFDELMFQGGAQLLPNMIRTPKTAKFKRLIQLKKSFLDNTRMSAKSPTLRK